MHSKYAILRTPEKLVAYSSRPRYRFVSNDSLPAPEKLQKAYRTIQTPLEKIPTEKFPLKERLLTTWNELSSIRSWDAELLKQILIILIETLPSPTPNNSNTLISFPKIRPRQIQPTAAHPRYYKGTKARPPKLKHPLPLDLRTHLCSTQSTHHILLHLREFWNESVTQLNTLGYDSKQLEHLHQIFPQYDRTCEPYLAFHHTWGASSKKIFLPPKFTQDLLPLLRTQPWENVLRLHSLYWKLNLKKCPDLRSAIGYFLQRTDIENGLHWLEILSAFPEEFQLIFIALLNLRRSYKIEVNPDLKNSFRDFQNLTTFENFPDQLNFLLVGLNRKISIQTILGILKIYPEADIRLENDLKDDFQFPADKVLELESYIKDTEDYYPRMSGQIWHRCGLLPGFEKIITETEWSLFTPKIACGYLRFWLNFIHTDVWGSALVEKWRYVFSQRTHFEQLLTETDPEYQSKFLEHLGNYIWRFDRIPKLKSHMPDIFRMLKRLCAPSYNKKTNISPLIGRFLFFASKENREMFLNAPDSSFLAFEKACRSNSLGELIINGFITLLCECELFSIHAFNFVPKQFIPVLKSLGTLKKSKQEKIAKNFNQIAKEITLPISIKEMTELLDTLNLLVLGALQENLRFEFLTENLFHALQFLSAMDDNRRPLRKFLKEYLNGNTHYRENHPHSRTWMQKHPKISMDMWLSHNSWVMKSGKFGTVKLEVEQNPFETLKCGTYVKSCLGLGGSFMYSAAAIVLDVNKQVIYARNEQGKVIARQTVAISDENELVCFEVYPVGVDPELRSMFQVVDHALACSLKIPLHHGGHGHEYTISKILAQEWWDDGAWDVYCTKNSQEK